MTPTPIKSESRASGSLGIPGILLLDGRHILIYSAGEAIGHFGRQSIGTFGRQSTWVIPWSGRWSQKVVRAEGHFNKRVIGSSLSISTPVFKILRSLRRSKSLDLRRSSLKKRRPKITTLIAYNFLSYTILQRHYLLNLYPYTPQSSALPEFFVTMIVP